MNQKGKFYILNWAFSYGSASSNRLLAYANSASALGHEVEIVALLRLNLKGYQSRNGITITGLYPCRIHNKFISKLISLFTTLWLLIKTIKKKDKILLYGSAEYLPLCIIFRKKQIYFEVTECPDLFPPRIYPFSIYKRLWKKLNGIFVISNNLKNYFIEHGVAPEKVHVINMIVDPSRFNGIVRNPNAEKYIAYCGNIVKDSKDGVGDLISSFAEYHKIYPDRKLYIIGPISSQEQKNKYDNYLKSKKIFNSVIYTDSISPTSIPQYFVDAEMLVLARPQNTQAKYGFPTKLGEYLLSGRPVVLTNVGNITDFLVSGQSAYIANPGDIEDISQKMISVTADLNKAEIIANKGKQIAMKEFNSDIETSKLLAVLYNE